MSEKKNKPNQKSQIYRKFWLFRLFFFKWCIQDSDATLSNCVFERIGTSQKNPIEDQNQSSWTSKNGQYFISASNIKLIKCPNSAFSVKNCEKCFVCSVCDILFKDKSRI